MIQLSKGLEAIHEAEVVHRDIKPENIFIGDSQRLNLKIGDLGISRVIDTGTEYQIGYILSGICGLSDLGCPHQSFLVIFRKIGRNFSNVKGIGRQGATHNISNN